jgi:hypothetical protein
MLLAAAVVFFYPSNASQFGNLPAQKPFAQLGHFLWGGFALHAQAAGPLDRVVL